MLCARSLSVQVYHQPVNGPTQLIHSSGGEPRQGSRPPTGMPDLFHNLIRAHMQPFMDRSGSQHRPGPPTGLPSRFQPLIIGRPELPCPRPCGHPSSASSELAEAPPLHHTNDCRCLHPEPAESLPRRARPHPRTSHPPSHLHPRCVAYSPWPRRPMMAPGSGREARPPSPFSKLFAPRGGG